MERHTRVLISLVIGLSLPGCSPLQVQVRSAPVPSEQDVIQSRSTQSRTVAVPRETVFPAILNIFMDNGFVIRSANGDLGLVSFYQQWTDTSQHGACIELEGSAVFSAVGATKTLVRLVLSGNWQVMVNGGGPKSDVSTMVGGVQQSTPAEEYKKLLDLLEVGLLYEPR